MAMMKRMVILLISATLAAAFYLGTGVTSCNSPTVHTQKEVLEPGEDAVFTCLGNSSVYWNISVSVSADEPHIVVSNTSETDGRYASVLIVRNVSHMDAGLYDCSYESDISCRSGQQLFVDDQHHLFAPETIEHNGIIYAWVGEEFVVPCIPTSPKVVIRLENSLGQKDKGVIKEERAAFKIENGFVVQNTRRHDYGAYECIATLPGVSREKETKSFHVFVETKLSDTPRIDDEGAEGVSLGDNFNLTCSINIGYEHAVNYVYLQWNVPPNVDYSAVVNRDNKVTTNVLTIHNAKKKDEGLYVCKALYPGQELRAETKINILGPGSVLEVYTDKAAIEVPAGNVSRWVFTIKSYPRVKELIWKDGYGRQIRNNGTFILNGKKSRAYLRILNTSLEHAGKYTFSVQNIANKSIDYCLELNVTGPPELVSLETYRLHNSTDGSGRFYVFGSSYRTICTALGTPPPTIKWHWTSKAGGHEKFIAKKPNDTEIFQDLRRGSQSVIDWKATVSGELICIVSEDREAEPDHEESSVKALNIEIIDFLNASKEGIGIFGSTLLVESTSLNLTCAAAKDSSDFELNWFKDGAVINNSNYVTIFSYTTDWSIRRNLVIEKSEVNRDTGRYTCKHTRTNGRIEQLVTIQAKQAPTFSSTNLNNTKVSVAVGAEKLQLRCVAMGVPQPDVTWYKDGQELCENSLFKSQFRELAMIPIVISIPTAPKYHGNYSCLAKNEEGKAERYLFVQIDAGADKGHFQTLGSVIGVMTFFIVVLLVSLAVKHHKDKKTHARKVENLIKRFKDGNVGSINSHLPVTEQVDLLPYDDRLEFPKENLQIGKLLGHGAFGRVFKATAKDLLIKGSCTEVAVKEAIDSLDGSNLKALGSELKIMIHLGQHVNILNILGACTQDLKKGELFVIVEYCEFGNLLQYIQEVKQKKIFIDLRHAISREFNPYDAPNSYDFNRWSSLSSSNSRRDSEIYPVIRSETSEQLWENSTLKMVPEDFGSQFHSVAGSCCTDMTFMTTSEAQNQQGDVFYPRIGYDNSHFITTEDLACWSYQIACGMEYLTSRKVLHGDLAARNILLAKNNIIKICDFGLSRQLYKNMYKKKKKDELLPIKWMAIESILEGKFSPFSDVWSYGVVLWELFTLGKTPYPGQDLNDPAGQFYTELISGRRMEEPEYAPLGLHDLMLNCWNTNPLQRPSFTHILTILEKFMTDDNLKYYHGLNEPYSKITVEKMEGRQDYLQMMGTGECIDKERTPENLPRPTYENIHRQACISLRQFQPKNEPSAHSMDQGVNNEVYKISPHNGEETELCDLRQTLQLVTEEETPKQSVFINNGYVPNHFFDFPFAASGSGSATQQLSPSSEVLNRNAGKSKLFTLQRRKKLDSGVYSYESQPDHKCSDPFILSQTDQSGHIPLKVGQSVENQEYFQIVSPDSLAPAV